jgi:hypothetical protein
MTLEMPNIQSPSQINYDIAGQLGGISSSTSRPAYLLKRTLS